MKYLKKDKVLYVIVLIVGSFLGLWALQPVEVEKCSNENLILNCVDTPSLTPKSLNHTCCKSGECASTNDR